MVCEMKNRGKNLYRSNKKFIFVPVPKVGEKYVMLR